MTAIISLPCFLFFLVSAGLHFEALALPTGTCRCCVSSNGTGECLYTTVCSLIGANSSSATEANHAECYNATCSDVNASYCYHPEAIVTSATDQPPSKVVVITCATVVPAIVVILVFIGLLVYCQLRRVEKDPPKMLPDAHDMDESIRSRAAVIVPEDQVTSEHQSRTTGISGASTSGLRPSHSLRQDKEDWTPRGILKSGPSSTEALKPSSPSLSYGATDDKSSGRKASNERQQHTYKNVEMDKKVHDYINVHVAGLVNVDDDGNSPDYIETCPDYVNTPSRNSADNDDLDYENVDVSATTSQIITSPAETSKASMQSKSPRLAPKSKGSILAASSECKAVSSDWLASIRGDRVAPMDPDYVDMDAKSKAKTMFPFEFNSKATESTAATFVSAPDVRTMEMKPKPKPVRPHLYENENPADHRKPKTTTAQNKSTTNL